LLDDGATALVSFGLAGGLWPGLGPGSVVIAGRVLDASGQEYATHAMWRRRLLARLTGAAPVRVADLFGSDVPVTEAADKAALHRVTGAVAVDMESHAVAAVAAGAGVPFCALRAIADSAMRSLPKVALDAITAEGNVNWPWLIKQALTRPLSLRPLIALNRETKPGRRALSRVVVCAGPDLCGVGLFEKA
jgi:hopanoid-associated phosphorylase